MKDKYWLKMDLEYERYGPFMKHRIKKGYNISTSVDDFDCKAGEFIGSDDTEDLIFGVSKENQYICKCRFYIHNK